MYKSFNQRLYEKSVRFMSSKYGIGFLVLWSFFEASFWFIAPDFLLVIFNFLKPEKKYRFFLYAFLASLCGGVFYYVLNLFYFSALDRILINTPFVAERMIVFVRGIYDTYGVVGVLFQSFSFMSFKIWIHTAVASHVNPLTFFPLVMISRALRLYPVVLLAAFLSKYCKDFLRNHFLPILIAYAVSFVLLLIILE